MASHGGLSRGAGWALVAIQGALLAAIAVWPRSWGPAVGSSLVVGSILFMLGCAVILAAAAALGRALTPLPLPNGMGLSARGIYRFVRHPMYTGVIIACIGVATWRGLLVVWLVVGGLILFFDVKARAEEVLLKRAYPGYSDYARRTGRFLPRVGAGRGQ